jgi:hypothetical protein
MLDILDQTVIQSLYDRGFTGRYPHFQKRYPERIELLSFISNRYGNSFNIEVSTVFPDRSDETSNILSVGQDSETDMDHINVFSTGNRYRLNGMFNGWFYYTDVYAEDVYSFPFGKKKNYEAVSESKAASFSPKESQYQVQKSGDEVFHGIAREIANQMESAYIWWDRHCTPGKILKR